MIKPGDMIYDTKLFEDIDYISSINMHDYFSSALFFSETGENIIDLRETTPAEFANTVINSYDIKSSAHSIDTQLKNMGYRTTYRFSHKYNMTAQMRDRILTDVYKLDYFYNIFNHIHMTRYYMSESENDADNKRKVIQHIQDAFNTSVYYASYLYTNNKCPDFEYIKNANDFESWKFILSFIQGIGYEFHPSDIKTQAQIFYNNYEYDRHKYNKQLEFQQWCKDNYSLDTGCLILSDTNQDKLRKILTRQDTPYFVQILRKGIDTLLGHNL